MDYASKEDIDKFIEKFEGIQTNDTIKIPEQVILDMLDKKDCKIQFAYWDCKKRVLVIDIVPEHGIEVIG